MEKSFIEILNLIAVIAIVFIPWLKSKYIGYLVLATISLQVLISLFIVYLVFTNGSVNYDYSGSFITGKIPVRIDYLSAWFILIISFTFLTGTWYGIQYMRKYRDQHGNLVMHAIAFMLVYIALINICIVQNAIIFLVVWEIMALSAFILVIFEHYKRKTLKAGINFLIQSHISILFLTLAFIWVKVRTGSYDFDSISEYTAIHPAMGIGLFVFFFTGFAIKAGFVPFHTWLPLAHPAAPAHISGIMSGVIIKIGIYGILRMLLLIKTDFVAIGYFVIIVSAITGVYGVMLAIVQHNLKRLLAYHSIENIGIIGIGIGLGCLGTGTGNPWLVVAGYGGALLHTLNHSLFKSLLFFTAGTVSQVAHTMNIESLGGLIKKIPYTASLFLIGSLAICGLPPFNGFVSEFFIYQGLFKGLLTNQFMFTLVMLFSILALVLIGGLAMMCFTKAFGIVFLGTARTEQPAGNFSDAGLRIVPLYFIALTMLAIGVFPFLLSSPVQMITGLFPNGEEIIYSVSPIKTFDTIAVVGGYSLLFIFLFLILFLFRRIFIRRRSRLSDATWGCAYTGEGRGMEYSASSFIRTYRKLTEPILHIRKEKQNATGLYPNRIEQGTHPGDKMEYMLIDRPVFWFKRLLNHFVFLQNGNIQSYILYGFIFIIAAIVLPVLISRIGIFINFLINL